MARTQSNSQNTALENEIEGAQIEAFKNAQKKAQAQHQVVHGAFLDITRVPTLVGAAPRAKAKQLLEIMQKTNIPILLIGDSGTGKSALMQSLLKNYAAQLTYEKWETGELDRSKKQVMPAYYFQLSRDATKTLVFMGDRMLEGSMTLVKGVMALAAQQGAPVGVDEIGHATENIITLFNSLDSEASVITNGDEVIDASRMRVIYGTNPSSHASNIQLPQSFTNRVLGFPIDYPDFNDEFEIAKSVAAKSYMKGAVPLTVPDPVTRYITHFMREMRKPGFPLSARNISRGVVLCELSPIKNNQVNARRNLGIDKHFTSNNSEALRRTISRRIFGVEAQGAEVLQRPEVLEFIEFVSKIGVPAFKEILLYAVNYYVDSAGLSFYDDVKQNILNSLI